MDEKLFAQIRKANEESMRNPGKNSEELPKEESSVDPEIYVFRHGQTYDNINRVFSGWRDATLTDEGIMQAEELVPKLRGKHIDLCIVSPQIRSIHTAKIALREFTDVLFEEEQRVMERNYGELQGHSKQKMLEEDPELLAKYRRGYDFPPPRGESLKMVEERVFPFCDELVERIKANNINVVLSLHSNSMRAVRRYFEDLSIVEELTIENPTGQDYAEYVVKNKNFRKSGYKFPDSYLNKLDVPNKTIFE